jgi:hypothetical protein
MIVQAALGLEHFPTLITGKLSYTIVINQNNLRTNIGACTRYKC